MGLPGTRGKRCTNKRLARRATAPPGTGGNSRHRPIGGTGLAACGVPHGSGLWIGEGVAVGIGIDRESGPVPKSVGYRLPLAFSEPSLESIRWCLC
jgi:hypothetical protein